MMMALLATIPLLVKAAREPDWLHLIALSVFALSMFLFLYTASTTYHSLDISAKVNRRLQKVDHMMIFVLIAGSYTPICLIALKGHTGKLLCILVWSVALVGIIVKSLLDHLSQMVFFPDLHRHGMAVCTGILPDFHALSRPAFGWLLAGGIIYTIGGIIYALKVPIFNAKHKNFGSHEIFHLFVMGGSACHFVTMFLLA